MVNLTEYVQGKLKSMSQLYDIIGGKWFRNAAYIELVKRGIASDIGGQWDRLVDGYGGILSYLKKMDWWKTTGQGDTKLVHCDQWVYDLIVVYIEKVKRTQKYTKKNNKWFRV